MTIFSKVCQEKNSPSVMEDFSNKYASDLYIQISRFMGDGEKPEPRKARACHRSVQEPCRFQSQTH